MAGFLPPCCPIPWMVYYSYHFSDFLEEKVILSCKGMYFFCPLSPEWWILFRDEEVFLLHWYIIAAKPNQRLPAVSRDQFGPHTLWPWHLRNINPTVSLPGELTLQQKKRKKKKEKKKRKGVCEASEFLQSWSIGRKCLTACVPIRLLFSQCCQQSLSPPDADRDNIWVRWQTVETLWVTTHTAVSHTLTSLFSACGWNEIRAE